VRLIATLIGRTARRSRWLARRLWLIAALEVAWIANRHWRRLEPDERRRLRELAKKSKGRPSKLTDRERREARSSSKLDYAEFGGHVTTTLLRSGRSAGSSSSGSAERGSKRKPDSADT
jgi:hypothetical protein